MNETNLKTIIFTALKQVAPDASPANLQPDENIFFMVSCLCDDTARTANHR